MILFPLYIAAIWVPAFLHRRRPIGFLIALFGPTPVMLSAWMIGSLMPAGSLMRQPWWLALYGSITVAMLVGGVLLACAPRRSRPHECRACHYDLRGNVTGVCPECGASLDDGVPDDHGAETAPFIATAAASHDRADPRAA